MKYNLSQIMRAAWRFFRKGVQTFTQALRLAWANAKAHSAAKAAAGITEETHSWSGWRQQGHEVVHGSKAMYKVVLADPATKSGTRLVSYFGTSQVQSISA